MREDGQTRSEALDGLRGLAATSVIFFHAILHHEVLVQSVLPLPIQDLDSVNHVLIKAALSLFNGNSAVLLFFVLSGFVLRLSLERSREQGWGVVWPFVARRICRLYPAMIFCMACYYLLALLYWRLGWAGFPVPDLAKAAINATLWKIPWHGPSTTIQAEMFAVPFILAFFFVTRSSLGSIASVLFLAYSIFAIEMQKFVLHLPNMNSWLFAFVVGMVVADRRLASYFSGQNDSAIIALGVAFFMMRAFTPFEAISGVIAQVVLCGGLIAAVYYAAPGSTVIRFLELPVINLLGRVSYSLYLLNVLVLHVLWSFTDPLGLHASHTLLTGLVVGVLATVLSLPLAIFSERVFEQGGIRLGRALVARTTRRSAEPAEATS